MAAIEIPDSYWDISPPGFQGLVAPHLNALADVFDQVNNDHASLSGGDVSDLEQQLGTVDGDADVLDANVANQTDAVHNAGTGEVLAQYGSADALAAQASNAMTTPQQDHGPGTGDGPPTDTGI